MLLLHVVDVLAGVHMGGWQTRTCEEKAGLAAVCAWEGEAWGRLVQERKQGRDDGPYVGAENVGSRFGPVWS